MSNKISLILFGPIKFLTTVQSGSSLLSGPVEPEMVHTCTPLKLVCLSFVHNQQVYNLSEWLQHHHEADL